MNLKAIFNDSAISNTLITLLILSSLIILGLSIPIPYVGEDDPLFALIALKLLDGHLPYQEIFDHKPIGIYYIYALFLAIFGKGFISLRIMAVLFFTGTALSIYKALKNCGLNKSAIYAGVATSLAFTLGLHGLEGNTGIISSFLSSLLFLILSLKPQQRSRTGLLLFIIFGIVVAIGFNVNYLFAFVALFTYLGFFTSQLFEKTSLLKLFSCSLYTFSGFLIGTLLILSPYLIDFFRGGSLIIDYFFEQSEYLNSYKTGFNKAKFLRKLFTWVVPFGAFLSLSVYLLNVKKYRFLVIFSVFTFLGALIGSAISHRFFDYYWLFATVPLSIFVALSFDYAKNTSFRVPLALTLFMSASLYIASASQLIIDHYLYRDYPGSFYQINRFFTQTIKPEDKVLSLSVSPAHAYLNDLNVNQKYLFPSHVELLAETSKLDGDRYYRELIKQNPDYILTPVELCTTEKDGWLPETCASLQDNYILIKRFDLAFGNLEVDVFRIAPNSPVIQSTKAY